MPIGKGGGPCFFCGTLTGRRHPRMMAEWACLEHGGVNVSFYQQNIAREREEAHYRRMVWLYGPELAEAKINQTDPDTIEDLAKWRHLGVHANV